MRVVWGDAAIGFPKRLNTMGGLLGKLHTLIKLSF